MNLSNDGLGDHASAIRDWLLEHASKMPDLGVALEDLCARILEAGVPIARVTTAVQLLHASNEGVGREWHIGEGVVERVFPYGPDSDRRYEKSPFAEAHRIGQWLELRPQHMQDDSFGVIPEFKAAGYSHYICMPFVFLNGRTRNGASFATRAPNGFEPAHFQFLRTIAPALRCVMEIRAGERILTEVLQTYVGGDPQHRILAGDTHRGTVTRIRSAILFSDLRGYTELSMARPEEEIASLLNRYFDCIVPAVEAQGGEVLKFIGDGVLAIFQQREDKASATCANALRAAKAALMAISSANGNGATDDPLDCGIALHYGEAAYGNVGSGARLDFTVIGRDINIANRITRLNGRLNQPILMSDAFVQALQSPATALGEFGFKGMPGLHPLFSPIHDTEPADA